MLYHRCNTNDNGAKMQHIIGKQTTSGIIASNHEAYALKRAEHNNIPSAVVCRKDYESAGARNDALISMIRNWKMKKTLCSALLILTAGIFGQEILKNNSFDGK